MYPLPLCTYNLLCYQHPHHSGACVKTDELMLTQHYYPKPTVYTRVHSWCWKSFVIGVGRLFLYMYKISFSFFYMNSWICLHSASFHSSKMTSFSLLQCLYIHSSFHLKKKNLFMVNSCQCMAKTTTIL